MASKDERNSDRTGHRNAYSRRKFLLTSGVVAGAGLAAGCTGGTGDGGDGGSSGGDGSSEGDGSSGGTTSGDGDSGGTTATGPESFTNEGGVTVGANIDAIAQLATEEDGATIYATIDREPFQAWMDEFNKEYPDVGVNHITGGSEDLISRWDSEYKSGNAKADAYISTSKIKRTWENGQTMELNADIMPSFGEAPSKFKSDAGNWIATRQVLGSVYYNTNQVSESDAGGWMDIVTDSKWSGQKIGWDPTPNMFLMNWLQETHGKEFFEGLREQRPRFVDSHTDLARFAGAGEFPVSFTYTHKMGRFGEQLPLDYFKFDPMPSVISPVVISNKAPNPNSALLFMNWLTSKAGQQVLGQTQYIPWHPEAEYTGYPGVYPSDEYEVDTISPTANIDATSQMWQEVMGDLLGQ